MTRSGADQATNRVNARISLINAVPACVNTILHDERSEALRIACCPGWSNFPCTRAEAETVLRKGVDLPDQTSITRHANNLV